jgi:hypothetical protein
VYRVRAEWPDASCEADVSVRSRWHYDARAKRCYAKLEEFFRAVVNVCPGELDALTNEPGPEAAPVPATP